MSTVRKPDPAMTLAQYIDWERQQTVRHEFYRGEVFSQAGGTRRHSQIGTNAAAALRNILVGRDCMAHGRDMRISIEATGYQAYPDVCEKFTTKLISAVVNVVGTISKI